jgi:enamine deaminase RidA (YjgF/YER057c/UK114 family)
MKFGPTGVGASTPKVLVQGDKIYLAGQVAEKTAGASVSAQTKEILGKIERLLLEAGSTKSKLLAANIQLADMSAFAEMNAVWDGWLAQGQTSRRTTVEAEFATATHSVEIAVIAAR